jgi:hypothetical protein
MHPLAQNARRHKKPWQLPPTGRREASFLLQLADGRNAGRVLPVDRAGGELDQRLTYRDPLIANQANPIALQQRDDQHRPGMQDHLPGSRAAVGGTLIDFNDVESRRLQQHAGCGGMIGHTLCD